MTWLPALWCFHCLQMECNHQCPDMCHSGSCPAPDTCDKKVYLRCACKRRKREARCCDKRGGEKLECDDVCTKAQAQKKEVRSLCLISQLKNAYLECEKFGCFSNSKRSFLAPHLVRAWSTYKDIRIYSFHHTHTCTHTLSLSLSHTHTLQIHTLLVLRSFSEKKT